MRLILFFFALLLGAHAAFAQLTLAGPAFLGSINQSGGGVGTNPGTNELVNNGSFELGMSNWVSYSDGNGVAFASTTVTPVDGTNTLQVNASSTPPYDFTYAYQDIPVTNNWTYSLKFWCRGNNQNDGRYAVENLSAGTNLLYLTNGVPGTTFTQITNSFTVPTGCSVVRLKLFSQIYAGNSFLYFYDLVSLK